MVMRLAGTLLLAIPVILAVLGAILLLNVGIGGADPDPIAAFLISGILMFLIILRAAMIGVRMNEEGQGS